MSDNSSAEKATVQQTWPSARQLLCHFHVAQAEWHWLTTSHNSVDEDQRRRFMSAFQLVMYADTAEKLEAATAELYCLDVLTRGHNTNNFAEATIRVLKDIILNRVEAFNAVALVDSVALVWEKYFESRILRHAYSHVAAHQLLYKQLLSRMPKDAAEDIQVAQEHAYEFLEVQLRRVHSMNAHNPAYLDIVKGLAEELARVQNSSDGTGLMLAFKATAAERRRRARHIKGATDQHC
ncbi:hypothetical protein MRX96_004809 [Rhipicephalus microplus]